MAESTFIKLISTAFGACVVYLLGGADVILTTLFIFLVVDYIAGIFKGIKNKDLSSDTGWRGLMKKTGVMLGVIVSVQLDKITGGDVFRSGTITFFTLNEGISIIENLSILGVEFPEFMLKFLKAWKDKENLKGVGEIEDNISSRP